MLVKSYPVVDLTSANLMQLLTIWADTKFQVLPPGCKFSFCRGVMYDCGLESQIGGIIWWKVWCYVLESWPGSPVSQRGGGWQTSQTHLAWDSIALLKNESI